MQFSDFKAKERTLQNGVVQRIEGDTILVDMGKVTGVLFPSEQIRGERYAIGQRLKVLILHVEPAAKGPKITLSRCHPDMVRKLFELEVPEVYNGSVEIKAVAREAGSRSKIAVQANQDGIDPIGACVGQKGSRVQTVMAELGGGKIDISGVNLGGDKPAEDEAGSKKQEVGEEAPASSENVSDEQPVDESKTD